MEEIHHLADKFTRSCPDSEEKIPQGDTCEAVFITLQEQYDLLTDTVNKKCVMLQQYIALWHNYNDLKESVSSTIDDVQTSVEEIKEKSHDPAVPPTSIVESANVCVYIYLFH